MRIFHLGSNGLTFAYGRARTRVLTVILGLFFIGQPIIAVAGDGFTLATGRTKGKSFAVGVGISSLAKVKLGSQYKMDLTAVPSQGFVDNVRMLQRDEAQFAVLQAMFGHFARTGTGSFAGEAPDDSIRAISMIWRDADHFVIDKRFEKTGTIADLRELQGQRVSLGTDAPGPIQSNRLLLSHLGLDADNDFDLANLNYQQSSEALKQGQIAAMSTPIRPPAEHLETVLTGTDQRHTLLAFTDEQVAEADGGLGLWTPYVIPAATYPGQDGDIQTVAKSNLLVARADVDEEVVYLVTKTMFEHLDFLRGIHDAMYETSVDRALVGVPIPLHPGAIRYYQEIGLLGPNANLNVALTEEIRRAENIAYEPSGAFKAAARPQPATPVPAASPADIVADARAETKTFVVHFGFDEKIVNGNGIQELAEVSAYADNMTTAELTISGHTDRSGDPLYNTYLAEIRARAVLDVLKQSFGIEGHEVKMEIHGSDTPAVDGGKEYQPQNRRVEIMVRPVNDGAPAEPQNAAPAEALDQPAWKKRAAL